jgi:hypothetical protein
MDLESVVAVEGPEDALARAQAFLESRGYRRTAAGLVRGSFWGTLSGLDPRRWKASVTVKMFATGHCGVRFDVDTTGHLNLLPSERKFWDDELGALCAVLRGEPPPNLDALDAATKAEGWRTAGIVLACATVMTVALAIVQVVGARSGVRLPPGFPGVGAGVGIVVGLMIAARTAAPRG